MAEQCNPLDMECKLADCVNLTRFKSAQARPVEAKSSVYPVSRATRPERRSSRFLSELITPD